MFDLHPDFRDSDPGVTPHAIYGKTASGRVEIQARTHPLSVRQRSLLILADGRRTAAELLQTVKGGSLIDLKALGRIGLIAPSRHEPERDTGPATVPSAWSTLDWPGPGETEHFLGRNQLYEVLRSLVATQLSTPAAQEFEPELEGAASLDDLRLVALRLVARIEAERGGGGARKARKALRIRR